MSTRTQTGKETTRVRRIRDDYLDLIREFPLRPIRGPRDYDSAAAVLDRLVVRPPESLTAGQRDYMETLTLLVESYDDEHEDLPTALSGLDALKYLMEQHGMKSADLGRLLGNRAVASLILNGRRGLSKTHIRILADYFKVEPGLFFKT
jgi:HTH-type transcriptional regulator/antitoxin HigA